jgi:hypothetical protein
MTLDFLEIESEFLRDNPWGDPYTRKVIVIRPPRAEGIPVVLYLSGYFSTVCPYTIISFILSSFMIECRDLALNHPLKVGGSWDSFEPNGTGLTSRITPTLLGIAHIGVGGHHLSAKARYKQI